MTRIIQQHPMLAARKLSRLVLAALVALLLVASAADAALTTGKCLGQKRTAWTNLRKCQGTEEAKQLNGKPADLAKCQRKFQDALAKITAKAAKAVIPCRYRDNGDLTVTDYDTGLQWEQKISPGGGLSDPHDVVNTYTWSATGVDPDGTAFTEFLRRLNLSTSSSSDGNTVTISESCFASHCDWRLPTIAELKTIVDLTQGICGGGSGPCIGPVFGPTVAVLYWSATSDTNPNFAWFVGFNFGYASAGDKNFLYYYVRAVRTGS